MKCKIFFATFLASALLSTNTFAAVITIDGIPLSTAIPPTVVNGRTLVPARPIFEYLGANVSWDDSTKTITALSNTTTIKLVLNESVATINDKSCTLDVPAQIINGRTMVPARFVAESFNCNVEWDNKSKTVAITKDRNYITEYVPYSTGNLETLTENILDGNVVYFNGQYWATPQYATMLANESIVYFNDISENDITEMKDRNFSPLDNANDEDIWVGGYLNIEKLPMPTDKLNFNYSQLKKSLIPNYVEVYGIYDSTSSFSSKELIYPFSEMTDEFMNAKSASGTFNDIRMYKENGILFANQYDLKAHNLLDSRYH